MSGQQLFVPSSVGRSYKKERQTGRQRKNSGAVSLSPFVHSFVRSFARRQRESFDSVRLFFSLSSFFSFFLLLSFCLSVRARGSGANFGSNTISLSGRIGKRRSIPMKEDSERERRCSMAGKKAPLACSLQSEPCKLAQFRLADGGTEDVPFNNPFFLLLPPRERTMQNFRARSVGVAIEIRGATLNARFK